MEERRRVQRELFFCFLGKTEVKQNALWSRVSAESEGSLFKRNMHGRVNAALKTIRL